MKLCRLEKKSKNIFQKKNFEMKISKKIHWKSLRKSTIFEKSMFFGFSIFRCISKMKNVGNFSSRKIFFLKHIFWFFQVDITSSDLNEFWIGQKILKAESILLNLSTTFMGYCGDNASQTTHTVQDQKSINPGGFL